jgi:hypothetical protein
MSGIVIKVYDGTGEGFVDQKPDDECQYVKRMDEWPWAVPAAKDVTLFIGGNSYDIETIFLGPDGTTEVYVSTDKGHALPQKWHEQVRAEGYVLESMLRHD